MISKRFKSLCFLFLLLNSPLRSFVFPLRSQPSIFDSPVPHDPVMDRTTHTVLQLDIQLRDHKHSIFIRNGISDILFRWAIDHVPYRKPFDSFVFSDLSATVDTDHVFGVSSILLAPAVVPSLARHTIKDNLKLFIILYSPLYSPLYYCSLINCH